MPSPFPGMDPYLESHWLDVHSALAVEARRSLNQLLPQGLIARVEERVAVEAGDEYVRRLGPDVRVFSPSTAQLTEDGPAIATIEAPFQLVVDLDPIIERFVRILDDAGRLITVIEFISPSNKQEPGLEDYRKKRGELLAAGVHVVEIDLVRSGNWRALMRPERCPAEAVSPYRAVVRTGGPHPAGYLFPIRLPNPLPNIPVPLRPGDALVDLPLQAMLTATYEDGRYGQQVNYREPAEPPLDAEDAAWVEGMLRGMGRR